MQEWLGSNPYALLIQADGVSQRIDLDEEGWLERWSDLLAKPGRWFLNKKSGAVVLVMSVHEGDRPFYKARHIGVIPYVDIYEGMQTEIIVYGIGKHRDGYDEVTWILPYDIIYSGDDVEDLGIEIVKSGLRRIDLRG